MNNRQMEHWFINTPYFYFEVKSLITSLAIMRPTVEGTKALLPGISLLIVHLRFVPGVRQLMDKSSIGRIGFSSK